MQDLKRSQAQILEDQDRGLDALAKVISRQKDIALRIGDEVETQNEIIDDLADAMDTTDARINSTTRRVNEVSEADSTCWYYITMLLLFVAIIVVSIL